LTNIHVNLYDDISVVPPCEINLALPRNVFQ
jgi:hypothetical protein